MYRGLPPKAAAVAAKATVGAVTQYAIDAWWPGLERHRLGRVCPTGGKGLAKTTNSVQTAAARAAIPGWKTTPTYEIRATCRFPPMEVTAGARRKAYRRRARDNAAHVAHSRAVSNRQTRLTDDTLVEASVEGWETKEDTRRPELWMPRGRLHALIADCTGYGRFAEYYARFGHDEDTVREAVCPCEKPLSPTPCDCPFLAGIVRPPLYGHTKGWFRKIN